MNKGKKQDVGKKLKINKQRCRKSAYNFPTSKDKFRP